MRLTALSFAAIVFGGLLTGCGSSTASNADVAADAKEMAEKGKGTPQGPPIGVFPGGANKPGMAPGPHKGGG